MATWLTGTVSFLLVSASVAADSLSLYAIQPGGKECLEITLGQRDQEYAKSFAATGMQPGFCSSNGYSKDSGETPLKVPFVSETLAVKRMTMSTWDIAKLKAEGFLTSLIGSRRQFLPQSPVSKLPSKLAPPLLSTATDTDATVVTDAKNNVVPSDVHKSDRYVATLRYLVPREDEIKFEQTWAKRQLAMGESQGFRYFQMSKRAADMMGPPLPDDEPNYMAYMVWDSKDDFEKFDTGAQLLLKENAEQFVDYDGLFALSLPPSEDFEVVNGWRKIEDEGRLPREAFVASNRFGIKPGFEKDFEDMWARRDSSLADLHGFKNFMLLRRRDGNPDDGNNYVSYTTWGTVQDFNGWRDSDHFKKSHAKPGGEQKESPYLKMPKVVTWKCFLVLSSKDGA